MSSTGASSTGICSTGDYSTGICSTGDYSTGASSTGICSTGDYSTGDYSTGDYSTGYRSTGDRSTGNWSISNYSTGHFSTIDYSDFSAFNKPCTLDEWGKAKKPNFLYFELTEWIESEKMTNKEKEENPSYKNTGGYLKVYEYKEAWKIAYDKASNEEIKQLKALPNFDAEVFKEISGIDINERDSIKVTANGKEVYISKDNAKALGLL